MPYKIRADGTLEPLKRSVADVLKFLEENRVLFVDLQVTDIFGRLHHVSVPRRTVDEDFFAYGAPELDGSSIKGFAQIYDSDLVLKPDPNTCALVPWSPERHRTARLLCDVYWGFGRGRLESDPRYIAQRAEESLNHNGFTTSYWGPELEFFVFDKIEFNTLNAYEGQSYRILSREAAWNTEAGTNYPVRFKDGYFAPPPYDAFIELRCECVKTLEEQFGIYTGAHHHEVATAGQCEIEMYRDTLTNMADSVVTCKYVIKNVAKAMNLVATFMPKPIYGDNASGMHVNVSLWRGDNNVFYDPDDHYAELSQTGRYFIGGLKEHARSLAAITNPTTNSYKRLVPGFEAPVYIAWGRANRSTCIRVPVYYRGGIKAARAKRVEYRSPDPSANPYLCFAAILAAGIDGIKKKVDPGDPIDENIYSLPPERRKSLNIGELPRDLREAIDELQSDLEYLKPIFTCEILDKLMDLLKEQALQVSIRPHPHEFYLYFDV
ncbi:MAG: type I glutamate--ammonia ligase [Candidatus Nezhaarchaeota archaeon]|nr:type I glutamate--ammonia ligase [Candidatus Nezhaarchaeota archaeon]